MLSCLNVSAKCQSYIVLLDVHSMPLLQATSCSRRVLSMQTLCAANSRKSGSREWCCLEEAESSCAALRHVVAMVHRPFPQMY